MKITQNEHSNIPFENLYGLQTFASFQRIIDAMITADELRLNSNECIEGITVTAKGLSFLIGTKC